MPFDILPPAFWIIATASFGLVIGSFLNVVIYRLPREESIVLPSSHCGSCGTAIKPYDNVPLLSFLALGGRCRTCRERISLRYPLVEALTAILFVLAYLVDGPTLELAFDCIFIGMVVPLIFIDFDHQILPNRITHPGLVFALGARVLVPNLAGLSREMFGGAWFLGLGDSPDWFVSLVGAAAGGTLGGGLLFVLSLAYQIVRKQEGMGLGDISMMCMVGAYLGWELTLLTLMLGSVLGSVVGIIAARGRRFDEFRVPFGVFLGAGALIALLAGERIIDWYLNVYPGD